MVRQFRDEDLPRILELNQAARPALGDLDEPRLRALLGQCAHQLVVVDAHDTVQGFLLAMEPGQPYASPNYRWLEDFCRDHVYVDRIAVAQQARGQGLGHALYAALERAVWNRPLSCEVNLEPPNDGSVRFHAQLGFQPLGEQATEGGRKRVQLMVRPSPWPVVVTLPVQWGDMDALGHVNNTVFFRWFESARIRVFERLGMRVDPLRATGPILATTRCDFLRPVHYPAEIAIGGRVSGVGTKSFTMEHAAWPAGEPGALVARGAGVIVHVDYGTGRSVPLPADVREAITALQAVPRRIQVPTDGAEA